jgi:hypothetical protein
MRLESSMNATTYTQKILGVKIFNQRWCTLNTQEEQVEPQATTLRAPQERVAIARGVSQEKASKLASGKWRRES